MLRASRSGDSNTFATIVRSLAVCAARDDKFLPSFLSLSLSLSLQWPLLIRPFRRPLSEERRDAFLRLIRFPRLHVMTERECDIFRNR